MEFTVAKNELQKELQLCQGVVERRSTIPILSNVLIRASKKGIELAATDLDVTLLTHCAATVKETGSWVWGVLQMGGLTLLAYLASVVVYQIGGAVSTAGREVASVDDVC